MQPPELVNVSVFGPGAITLWYDKHFLLEALRNRLEDTSPFGTGCSGLLGHMTFGDDLE